MEPLLLDACVAINLAASGVALEDLAHASAVQFVMVSQAAAETLWLAPLEPGGAPLAVNVQEFVDAGSVTVVELGDHELLRFIELAREIDDGEAATFAVAIHRGLRVATDDRRAQRLAAETVPAIPIVGTSEIVKRWVEESGVDTQHAAAALRSIELRASYVLRRDDPHFEWWDANVATAVDPT